MMTANYCNSVLRGEGFLPIGSLDCNVKMQLWHHPEVHVEVSVVEVEQWVLIRASKYYRLVAIGAEGELYTRDLAAFDLDLTTRFGEVHLLLSSFPDITLGLAQKRIAEKQSQRVSPEEAPNVKAPDDRLQEVLTEATAIEATIRQDEGLLGLDHGKSPLLQRAIQNRIAQAKRRLDSLRNEQRLLTGQLADQQELEREYQRKASATCLIFNCCSNIQTARDSDEFVDVLHAVVKEIQDVDRYQIRQKFQGGKLQIFIEEFEAPGAFLMTRWAGGVLCPAQLDRLGPEFAPLREAVERQLMVFPKEDIVLRGAVKDEKKIVAARVVRDFLERLEKVPKALALKTQIPRGRMPVWIGNTCEPGGVTSPVEIPLQVMVHTLVSGKTGCGKSFAARVLVEAAAAYNDLSILILDPRNQWIGLRCPEDRPHILQRYSRFGLDPTRARSFDFTYHGVGQNIGTAIPGDLRDLAHGRRIISFKGLDDEARCRLFADINNAVFEACAHSESDTPRVLIVTEEATRFLRKWVDGKAEEAARRAEQSIDQIAREGRKYGIYMQPLLVQSARDLSYAMATVRQNFTTHVFMNNSDREIEYAAGFLDDASDIVSLPQGEAYVCNPEWGSVRVAFRPPLSKVWEPSEEETRKLAGFCTQPPQRLSDNARAVLEKAREFAGRQGGPVRLSAIMASLGVTSRRRIQEIVGELERIRTVKLQRLNEQGRPLTIMLDAQ